MGFFFFGLHLQVHLRTSAIHPCLPELPSAAWPGSCQGAPSARGDLLLPPPTLPEYCWGCLGLAAASGALRGRPAGRVWRPRLPGADRQGGAGQRPTQTNACGAAGRRQGALPDKERGAGRRERRPRSPLKPAGGGALGRPGGVGCGGMEERRLEERPSRRTGRAVGAG